MADISHGEILWIVGLVSLVIGAVLKSLHTQIGDMSKTLSDDHVHREEFKSLTERVDTIANNQSGVMARQKDDRKRLDMLETRHNAGNG